MIKIYLSRLLGERRWTQKMLAAETGIRQNTISDFYNENIERINIEHLNRLCESLECPLCDLMDYVPDEMKRTGKNLILEEHGNRKKRR